jgi:rod shape-determining protein MreC
MAPRVPLLNFLRRNRLLFASALCLLGGALLVARTTGAPAQRDPVGRFFLDLMAPFQRATASVSRRIGDGWAGVAELFRARRENVVLRERARRLEEELDRLAEMALENERLRRLLEFRETVTGDVVTARVIGHDATGLSRTLIIDRGAADGVAKGAAVLAPEGIVGQVFVTGRSSARVLLVSDHNSGVDAVVQRTRARGIVQGSVDGACALKYVKRTEDVQVGDAVVTSGFDGIFPKGLPIGRVTLVDKASQSLFQHAEVAPRVDFESLEELLVTRGPIRPAEPLPVPGE